MEIADTHLKPTVLIANKSLHTIRRLSKDKVHRSILYFFKIVFSALSFHVIWIACALQIL